MLNKITIPFLATILMAIFSEYVASEELICPIKLSETKDRNNKEFEEFAIAITSKLAVFQEHFDKSAMATRKILNIIKEGDSLDSKLQEEFIESTKTAQIKLKEFIQLAISFQNSANPDIRKTIKEFLKFYEYGNVVLQQCYNFILAPNDFISSKDEFSNLHKNKSLLDDQYYCILNLLKDASKVEETQNEKTKIQIELQYSPEELTAMEKWKNKTLEDLMSDALNGDAAALYMQGMMYLYGQGGFPININNANTYFATSALLGFAPALDKIKSMYLEETPNAFLFFVYLNLTSSFGHHEFTMAYHDQRKKIVEKCGNSMALEIERIASEKTMRIYKAMNQIKESKDKTKTTSQFLIENGIIGEDSKFNLDHWEKFYNTKK